MIRSSRSRPLPPPRLFVHRSDGIGLGIDLSKVYPALQSRIPGAPPPGPCIPCIQWARDATISIAGGGGGSSKGEGVRSSSVSVVSAHPRAGVAVHVLDVDYDHDHGVLGLGEGQGTMWSAVLAPPMKWVQAAARASGLALALHADAKKMKKNVSSHQTGKTGDLPPEVEAARRLLDWYVLWLPIGVGHERNVDAGT